MRFLTGASAKVFIHFPVHDGSQLVQARPAIRLAQVVFRIQRLRGPQGQHGSNRANWLFTRFCRLEVDNVSVETTKLIGSLNSTVTMINETIIGLVVCKSHIRRAFGWISHAQLIGL
jgi:hypothetical protein